MRPAAGAGFTLASADTIYDIRNTQGVEPSAFRELPSSVAFGDTFSP